MHCFKLTAFLFLFLSYGHVFGQPVSNVAYDIELRIVLGSNTIIGSAPLPADLSPFTKQINDRFGRKHVSLLAAYHARGSEGGSVDHRSIASILLDSSGNAELSSVSWRLTELSGGTVENGVGKVKAGFRFTADVPRRIKTGASSGFQEVINYTPVVLGISGLDLPESRPTLVGTLGLPDSGDMLFIFVSITKAQNGL
jgi:hypothetical protein